MNDAPNPTPAGWFPDPLGRHEHRYFNGQTWTADVADGGQRRVDPLGTSPGSGFGGGSPNNFSSNAGGSGGSTAAMVCGIIAVLIAWIPFLVVGGLILGILALVFGIRGIRNAAPNAPGRGKSIAGIVTGAIALALSIVGVWLSVLFLIEVTDFVDAAPNSAEVIDCSVSGSVVTVNGSITNQSNGPAEFTVFVDISFGEGTSTRNARNVVAVVVDTVPAGDTVGWQAVDTNRIGAESCTASADVFGPFPFGLEMDRP
ncbi:MAG TPA: DUF2510 domain-containing protein [Ilumatobacter sp.]|nr:DUF2510 domain-containing protein [Ilumatobacter sp.]